MKDNPGKFDYGNLAFLFVAHISERFIYYGFRSIFVLYLLSNDGGLGLSDIDASSIYQLMLIVGTFALLLVGPLIDFVLPKKLSLPVSFLFTGIGLLLCLSASITILTVGLIFIGIGSSMNKVSFYTKLDAITEQIPQKRNLVFAAFASLSSIFIILAPIAATTLFSNYNFKVVIATAAALSLIPLTLSFRIKSDFKNAIMKEQRPRTLQKLGLVALATFLGFIFWLTYDMHYSSLYEQVMTSFRESTSIIPELTMISFFGLGPSITIILGFFFTLLLWLIPKTPTLKTIFLSALFLITSCWVLYLIGPINLGQQDGVLSLLIILILTGMADAILSPLFYSYVLKTAPQKYKGIVFSISLVGISSVAFLTIWLEDLIPSDYGISILSLLALFIISALIYADKEIKRRSSNPVFPPSRPQE